MTDRNERRAMRGVRPRNLGQARWPAPPGIFAGAVLLAFAVAAGARGAAPQLTLPLTVSFLLLVAAATAAAAWALRLETRDTDLTHWDIAGALAFLGLGLSALIEAEHLVSVLEGLPRQDAGLTREDGPIAQ
jgi:hypothetical protein